MGQDVLWTLLLFFTCVVIAAALVIKHKKRAAFTALWQLVEGILREADVHTLIEIFEQLKDGNLTSGNLQKNLKLLKQVKLNLSPKEIQKLSDKFTVIVSEFIGLDGEIIKEYIDNQVDLYNVLPEHKIVQLEICTAAFNNILLSLSGKKSWEATLNFLILTRQTCMELKTKEQGVEGYEKRYFQRT